jgi:filamentous hemagglutinin family protein
MRMLQRPDMKEDRWVIRLATIASVLLVALVLVGCPNDDLLGSGDEPRTEVAFSGLTANGEPGVTTTELTLSFGVDPTTLAASHITVTGATKGALNGSGTTRTLVISDITVANGEDVTVSIANPDGFSISPASRNVAVYSAVPPSGEPVAVAFSGLTANGSSGTTTTDLTLTFDVDPTTLTADDITVTGATKGALSGTGTTRTLGISGISVADGEEVTVAIANPNGYTMTPGSRTVAVNVARFFDTQTDGAGAGFVGATEGSVGIAFNRGAGQKIVQ